MPSRSMTVTCGTELRGDQRGLVAGRSAADDHDAGHGSFPGARRERIAVPFSPVPSPDRCDRRPSACRIRSLVSAPMGLYAAYGSNMDPAQMLRRCPSSPHTGTGWIRGWRLTFGAEEYGWEGALATLVPDDDTGPGRLRRALRPHRRRRAGARRLGGRRLRPLPARAPARAHPRPATRSPTSTCWTPSRAACRRPGTWAGSPTPPRPPARPTDYVPDLRSRECRSTF